jgi:uncharacterized protein (TIGR04255 family)
MLARARPIADANSIDAVAFALILSRPFGHEELARVAELRGQLQSELPGFEQQQSMSLDIVPGVGTGVMVPLSAVPGPLVFFRTNSAGQKEWQLAIVNSQILVTCQTYTRWSEVWRTAQRLMVLALRRLDPANTLQEIGMQVVDKFVYDQRPGDGEYSITDVFRPDCPYLTPHSFESGTHWHVYQGWFENAPLFNREEARLLHQVHLSSGDQQPLQQLIATLDHRAVVRVLTPDSVTLARLLEGGDDHSTPALESIYGAMHSCNKRVVAQCLSAENSARVQLGASS